MMANRKVLSYILIAIDANKDISKEFVRFSAIRKFESVGFDDWVPYLNVFKRKAVKDWGYSVSDTLHVIQCWKHMCGTVSGMYDMDSNVNYLDPKSWPATMTELYRFNLGKRSIY